MEAVRGFREEEAKIGQGQQGFLNQGIISFSPRTENACGKQMQWMIDSEKKLLCFRGTCGGVEQTRTARGPLDVLVQIAAMYNGCSL